MILFDKTETYIAKTLNSEISKDFDPILVHFSTVKILGIQL